MQEHSIKIGDSGRVIIPAVYRKAMGIVSGDELILRMQSVELRLFRQGEALKRARMAIKKYNKNKDNNVEDFLAFRSKDSE